MNTDPTAISRRSALLGAAALGAAALGTPAAWAQAAWPTRPVTLLVGYPPGGQTDFAARVLLANLQASLGQPVVIDNKAGVNGNLAAAEVLQVGPRRLQAAGRQRLHDHHRACLHGHLAGRPAPAHAHRRDAAVGAGAGGAREFPVKTYADFVDHVKARHKAGKSVDYGTGGIGALPHVTMELLRERLGNPQMSHVPYKGSGPAMTDLIAGRLDALFDATSVLAPFIKSGQLRALLVTTDKRVPALPDVPTAAEAGLKDFNVVSFIGLYGPPKLPAEIVKKANAALNAALKDPAVAKGIVERGDEPGGGTPEHLATLTRDQFKIWGDVVKANNIRAE